MKSKYFDPFETRKIIALKDSNPYEAIDKFETYLEKYPLDYNMYSLYIYTLIAIGKLDEAEKMISYVDSSYKRNISFFKIPERLKRLELDQAICKAKLAFYKGDYHKCLRISMQNKDLLPGEKNSLNLLGFYCRVKLGISKYNKKEENSYLFNQIISYSEEDFLTETENNINEMNPNSEEGAFNEDFDLRETVEEIKKYIPSERVLFYGTIEDLYVFKYDNVGKIESKVVDYIKLRTIHNTSNITTITPMERGRNLPYVDLNYLKKDEKPKEKRLSQIEKFNKRYGKNLDN